MKIALLSCGSRSATFEIETPTQYYSQGQYEVYLNNEIILTNDKNVFTLNCLIPNKEYDIRVKDIESQDTSPNFLFKTENESVRLNVTKFGAKGDGISNDTHFIQTAIMCCPKNGTVYLPKGTYMVTSIFLKSDITIDLSKGAIIKGIPDRNQFSVIPGFVETTDEMDEYYMASWEGNPLDSFASIITGVNVENVKFIGEGVIDGNGQNSDWWHDPKKRQTAWRPRSIFLNQCKNIVFEGIKIQNSPSWTVHPFYSDDLKFLNLEIVNPKNSPNTDGIDPESCKNVDIIGVKFSVGDDCIAIKSSKIYMGKRLRKPSANLNIRNCYMEHGHGGVVIGSEIAGGVQNVLIEKCIFKGTDKGIRVKTRRGRGKDSIINGITAENIYMDEVKVPFVINAFYFCDPDGKTKYVWTKEALPVDERTPEVKNIFFKDIVCKKAQYAAGFVYGLPEKKIENISLNNITVEFDDNAQYGFPAMMSHCPELKRAGFVINNASGIDIKNLNLINVEGEKIITENSENIVLDA